MEQIYGYSLDQAIAAMNRDQIEAVLALWLTDGAKKTQEMKRVASRSLAASMGMAEPEWTEALTRLFLDGRIDGFKRVHAWHQAVRTDDAAPSTIHVYLSMFKSAARWLQRAGVIDWNLSDFANVKGRPRKHVQGPDWETFRTMLSTMHREHWRGRRLWHFVHLLGHTGLRLSEALGLRTGDVSLSEPKVFVKRKGKDAAWLRFPTRAMEALRHWMVEVPVGGWVFPGERNRAVVWQERDVRRELYDLGEAYGLPYRLHPHALRHTFCTKATTEAGRKGYSLAHVIRLTGHSDTKVLQRYLDDTDERAAELGEEMFDETHKLASGQSG